MEWTNALPTTCLPIYVHTYAMLHLALILRMMRRILYSHLLLCNKFMLQEEKLPLFFLSPRKKYMETTWHKENVNDEFSNIFTTLILFGKWRKIRSNEKSKTTKFSIVFVYNSQPNKCVTLRWIKVQTCKLTRLNFNWI